MKIAIISLLALFIGEAAQAQKLMTRSGDIRFEATMPTFEEIAAINTNASCIFDEATGEIAALVLIKSFKFKSPLMEEHFNENYLESTKYPKATFKGKIVDFDAKKLSATKTTYDLDGELTMHGVIKKIKARVILVRSGDKVIATAAFPVKAEDYKIEIPSLVKNKIAEDIKVTVNFTLEEK